MRRQIRVITPIVTEGLARVEDYQAAAGPDTEISMVLLQRGPASIESEFDHALAVPDTLAKAIEAEKEGIDALIINCMGDPGMKAAREVVSIPVIGPAQASMHVASMLGHKFSIVTILDRVVPMLEDEARVYGVQDKLASVRWVDIPVLELEKDPQRLVKALVEESVKAIEQDRAHVIIFGCTGMFGFAEAVERGLVEQGYRGVPVVDPIPVAIKMAEVLVDLRLSQSKRTYPPPPEKLIVGYDVPQRKKLPTEA